jgi:hypothetical protein
MPTDPTTETTRPGPVLVDDTSPGAVALSLLARYTLVDLARIGDPDLAELASLAEGTGRPVFAAVCRRMHHAGDDEDHDERRIGPTYLTAQAPAGGVTNNLGDLAQLALDHAIEHHGHPRIHPAAPDPAGYDWTRYQRTCDPDRQLDGLGDLCLFLGGSWSETPGASSFIGELLKLIVKAQATPERFAALERGFPREVFAWRVWMTYPSPVTAAGLCAALTMLTGEARG